MQQAMFSHPVVVIVPSEPPAKPWALTAVDLDGDAHVLEEDLDLEPIKLPLHSFASPKVLAAATAVGIVSIALLATLTSRPRDTSSAVAHAPVAAVPARQIPPPDGSLREARVVTPSVTHAVVAALPAAPLRTSSMSPGKTCRSARGTLVACR
jgi:hypothetical protein